MQVSLRDGALGARLQPLERVAQRRVWLLDRGAPVRQEVRPNLQRSGHRVTRDRLSWVSVPRQVDQACDARDTTGMARDPVADTLQLAAVGELRLLLFPQRIEQISSRGG